MLPAGNYWLLIDFHVDWVLLRGITFSMWCHFPVVLFLLEGVEDNGTRCDLKRSSSPSSCPKAGSTVLKSFPTDVCLTSAVSCRQKSKITKNEKEDVGYGPYIVFLVTYSRRRNINWDIQTGQSGHVLLWLGTRTLQVSVMSWIQHWSKLKQHGWWMCTTSFQKR